MTYLPNTKRPPLGGISDAIGGAVSAAAQAAGVASDPFSQELICRIKQIVQLETGGKPGPCQRTPITVASPAGLKRPVVAMRGYVWAEQRKPWSYPAAIAVAMGVPFLLGYLVGRK